MEIILKNKAEERQKLLAALEQFALAHHLPPKALQAADLALEEHLTNVLNHAYSDRLAHEIIVRLSADEQWLQIEVEDDGQPFDPTARPEVDLSIPLEKRPIGGLGVHLMRRFMDELEYRRVADRNVLRMRKRLTMPNAE